MKRKLLIPLIIVLLLTAFALPTNAGLVPDVSGSYTITTTPAVDPAIGAIPVNPGQTITLSAVASITYEGSDANGVGIVASVDSYLYLAGVEKASSSKSFTATYNLKSGNTYTVENQTTITVPADAAPGLYTLKVIASATASYLGMTYNQAPVKELYVVKVLGPAPSPGVSVTPSPVPTPVPGATNFSVNSSTMKANGDGNSTFTSGEVTGNANGGTASGYVDVNLTGESDGSLDMYMTDSPDPKARTQFMLAASNTGSDIRDIACVLVVEHPTLANGKEITSAMITMKVSRAWVDANGGIDAIKILRYSDGVSEALETTCLNGPDGDPLIFQAYSPHGLSQFALAAVASLPLTAAETAPVGVQVGSSLIIGIVAAIVILLVAIIGVAYVLGQRNKNKKQ